MTVYVTVETFQGVLDNVRAYLTEESTLGAEKNWLREMGITAITAYRETASLWALSDLP